MSITHLYSAMHSRVAHRHSENSTQLSVRVLTPTITDLCRHRAMMNPFKRGFYAVQLFSHKVMRYFVPFFLIASLVSSAILATESRVYLTVFIAQFAAYLSAFAASVLEQIGIRSRLLA